MLPDMATRGSQVGDILVKAGLLDPLQLRSALAKHDQWGGRLAKLVVDLGFAPEDAVVDALAKELFLKRVQLGQVVKDPPALKKLDAHYCEERAVFPVGLKDNGKTLVLAMADPTDLQVVDEVAMKARARVLVMCAGEQEIQSAIARYYHQRQAEAPSATRRRFTQEEAIPEEAYSFEVERNGLHASSPDATPPDAAPADGFGPDALSRMGAVRENQEKSARVLRALTELLEEKGLLSR
jgi:hypothetical protein